MKPVRRVDSTSQSCSCTSCIYKSESEQPSIRKYVAHGSRIDRLYFGKYIPLRERKLLNRLVRTRAVYDDLRARLISDSTLSLEKNADLRPGKHHRVIKPLDSEQSGAILEIVDIIDKGAALSLKKHSDCCSCCSCSSKSKILNRNKKERRVKKGYGQTYEEEYSEAGQAGTGEGFYARTYEKKYGKAGQIGTGEGVYATYEREFGKTIPGKTRLYNKRGVRFKAKHSRSDPCTCTFKFSGLIKKHSKAMFKKVRPLLEEPFLDAEEQYIIEKPKKKSFARKSFQKYQDLRGKLEQDIKKHSKAMFKKVRPPLEEPFLDAEEQYIIEEPKKKGFARKSFQKYQDLRGKLEQDMKKLNETKANMKQQLQLGAKKSLEQAKQVKNKIKTNIGSGVRKSLEAVKGFHPKETLEDVEYPEVKTTFKIKKDSLVKFKDYLKRKETMKDWECDWECEPEECVPEECFKIIKLRRLHKRNRQRDGKHGVRYEKINREVKVGGVPLSKSNSSVQAGQIAITTATHIKKHKPVLRVDGKNQAIEKRIVFETKQVKKVGGKKGVNKIVNKSVKSSVMPTSYEERAFRGIKKKGHAENKSETLNERGIVLKKPHSRRRQAVRIKSSFSFDLEFYKNRPEPILSGSSQPSGIHVHAPKRKRKKLRRRHESLGVSKSSLESSQGISENLKTRFIQTDKYAKTPITSQELLVSKISQCECEKHRNSNVKTNTNYGTKSVSSITNNVSTMDKNIFKEVKQKGRLSQASFLPPARPDTLSSGINESYANKQAVRIGSTFSFDIEFYKKDGEDVSKSPKSRTPQKIPKPVMEKVKRTRSKVGQVRRRLVKVKGTSTKAYNQAKTTLNRCFCTLKLNKRINTKKEAKEKPPLPAMIDKYVETKKNYRYVSPKLYDLLPYECEPGVCIPDECDPILCKKIIELRQQRLRRRISKSTGSYTGSRKTKSTSSILSRPLTSARAKIVQSSTVPTKVGSTGASRRYKNNFNLSRNEVIQRKNSASERQAVRIGSSFSFNIEFYKDTQNPGLAITNKPSLSTTPTKNVYKEQKFTEQRKNVNKRNKSMFTEVMKVNKYIGPPLKNCLCTLKLYKNKVPKKKLQKKPAKLTQTFREVSIGESVNKGTRTKKEHRYKLLPYECEPYICVPGECDPYICLQNIKRRELNSRNIGVFTDKPDMHSMSSLTENSLKKSEAILVHPKQFRKGTNMKAKYFKALDGRPRPTEETFIKTSKSKQAVRIGSSFNFSIEFSKQMPGPVTLTKYPNIKQSANVYPKIKRDQGITVTKVRVNHGDTQALEPKKVNKSSLVRPMLKRCFCTLNLQNKTKQQYRKGKQQNKYFGANTYTVGRATTTKTKIISNCYSSQWKTKLQLTEPTTKVISVSTSSFLLNKYHKNFKSKYETVKIYSTSKIPIQYKEPVVIKSNLSMKLNISRQALPSKESWVRYIKQPLETFSYAHIDETSHENLKLFNLLSNQNLMRNTGIGRYLERCFCTMNVKISHPRRTPGIKKIGHKLKPYECEPGICIPGECDPYECKKLIMRRFANNVHKGSGTKSKSISRYAASDAGIDSRSTQMETYLKNRSQITVPQQYKTERQHEAKHRQTVRLKSSFSFDLEFYKHQSQPFKKYVNQVETITYEKKPVNQNTNEAVNKGSQENNLHGKATKLKSTVTSVHKGTASKTKRCFCTMKLQKKGRIHREHVKLNSKPAKHLPIITSRNVKIGTAAKYRNIPVDLNDLNFYECEPGICVPGQCDPYKCLELMKHRKNFGINTIQRGKNSVSSMTSEEKYKTRAIKAIPLTPHHKSTKTIKYVKNTQSDNNISQISSTRSTRPAVRIGSSFSFNIEFFKDMPQELQYHETNMRMKNILKSDTKKIKGKKETKAITSLSRKSVSQRATVVEKPLNDEATITTSLMKRCFCTAKLRSPKVPKNLNRKTFKQKCFCVLGLHSKENKNNKKSKHAKESDVQDKGDRNNQSTDKPVKTAEKPTNTNVKYKVYSPYLEPYECEPGICIPGQCDPYLCEKIIQKRLAKQRSKKSETDSIQTHSASSGFGNYKRSKNERIQAHGQTNKKQIQHVTKDIAHPSKNILNADKRLVRIGSNFSFNIEFYKENVDNSVIKEKVKEVKTYLNKDAQEGRILTGNILKSIGTETVVERNKQKVKTKNNTSDATHLLKRCFCTLKLMNKQIKQIDLANKSDQLDTKPIVTTKAVETQSYKYLRGQTLQHDLGRDLSPYECEPFVCVPGQCDPVECLKRIKKRQQHTKESSTLTQYPKRKSIGNVANKMKDKHSQVKELTTRPLKSVQKTNSVEKSWPEKSYNQPRQAVRIGSNFSFNIEFFKDVGGDMPNVATNRPVEELNIQKYSKKVTRHNAKTQPINFKHNVDSQVISTKLQTTDTATAHLKRCFCTLPLRNKHLSKQKNVSLKIQSNQPVSHHSSVGNFLKKCMCTFKLNKVGKQHNQPPIPAVKYEIKGTSTQSRRAPQNNNRKPVRILEPYECEPFICVPGECDPYECLKRIQRRQVRDFGTDYKRYVKDSATDSIKQPSTRSTKAQSHKKGKFNSRGTASLVSRRTRRSKAIAQFQYDPSHNTNRQVVRIGSNFSFNIELFKDHGTGDTEHFIAEKAPNTIKRPQKRSTKSRGSINAVKRPRDKKSQCSCTKKHVPSSTANIAPKKCFCTLKLLKKPKYPKSEVKLISRTIPTKDKAAGTKIKYAIPQELSVYECPPLMCIPGECNPYECLENFEKRKLMRKSRNVGTRAARTSIASVGNRATVRAHKIQSQIMQRRNVIVSAPHSEPQSELLKSSRNIENINRRNKCAVRIGSNFNFNVKFVKQNLQPAVAPVSNIINARYNEEDSISDLNKNVTAGAKSFGHSYINKTKLKDQGSDAVNSLKRCFCTLQLQKPNNQKNVRLKMHRPVNSVRYPQIFTVGRVAVVPVPNTVAKISQTKKVDRARSTFTDPKLLNKTTGTATKRKYLDFPSSQCNPNNCPDYKKRFLGRKIENDMHTILPFTPSKFKKESKTCLSINNKLKKNKTPNQLTGVGVLKLSDTSIVSKGKRRLTAKKSKKSIPTNSLMEINSRYKNSLFCRCVRFFFRKSEARPEDSDKPENLNTINKQVNKTKTIPAKIKLTIPPKKAKSFGDNCPFICPKDITEAGKNYSILQSGDVNNSIMKAFKHSKIDTNRSKIQGRGKFVTFADNAKYPNDVLHRRKTNKSIHSKSSPRTRLCYSCSVNDYPLNKSDQQTSRGFKIREKSIKSPKKVPSYSESVYDCQYCACCKRKIDMDEISKGGGDRRLTISSQYKGDADKCPCGKESMIESKKRTISVREKSKADNRSRKYSMKKEKCCNSLKPFLEIRLDPHSHNIINKGEVKKSIDKLYSNRELENDIRIKNNQHDLCICCKCLKKRDKQQKAVTTEKPQKPDDNSKPTVTGAKDVPGKFKFFIPPNFQKFALTALNPPKKTIGPCICGSKICAKQSKKIKSGKLQEEKPKLFKTCVCGSDICAIEQKKILKDIEKAKNKARSIIDEKERKIINRRVAILEDNDSIRRLRRIKRNKKLEKRVKEYKDSTDLMLAVDSLLDVGKLGVSSLAGGLRCTTKAVIDPKVTFEMLCKKYRKNDVRTLLKQLLQEYSESNAGATVRRLKMRCLYMKKVQSLIQKLEGNAFTHFILHMADKNPKTRKFKPKPKRHVREPVDFQCSLYMATLRRRPYLSVYYKWPWFYPHFMSMLNIWRQFTDIMLFLIAAIAWSPCILCMEGCRALMCCLFCTG